MVNALFTALALIAAGQGGSVASGVTSNQMRSSATSESPRPAQARDPAASAARRHNG